MVLGTLDALIDTVESFLMIHPDATLKDFITFLEKTRTKYIKGEE